MSLLRPLASTLALLIAALLMTGCASSSGGPGDVGDRQLRVTATTNFIADVAREVGGGRAEVTGLMGPGVDPHLYSASAGDVRTLREADLILYNGLNLEERMEQIFADLSSTRPTVAVTRLIPEGRLLESDELDEEFDPHVWFSVPLWREAVAAIVEGYVETDPDHAEGYRARGEEYLARLDELDRHVRARVEEIPPRRRVLVTSHDAFGYFGEEYGFEVAAIQGISTASEATTSDIERVAALVAERGLPVVFIESSVPRQTIDAVLAAAQRRGQSASVGGELFADAAGDEGTQEGTYIGMVRHNIDVIADGLTSTP